MKKENGLDAGLPSDKKPIRETESDKVLKGYFDKLIKLESEGQKSQCWKVINAFTKDEKSMLYNYCTEKGSAESLKLMIINSLG